MAAFIFWGGSGHAQARLKAAMRELAAAHGGHDRRDDLDAMVRALLRMPGFHGVRAQVIELLRLGRKTWARTHRANDVYPWPDRIDYLDKGSACYHTPEPLRLDGLVKVLAARCAGPDEGSDWIQSLCR